MSDRQHCCCFTGHRELPPQDALMLPSRVKYVVAQLYLRGYDTFFAGGALGFDTIAARAVLELRDNNRLPVSLILELPYPTDESYRPRDPRETERREIRQRCDGVRYAGDCYDRELFFIRNRRMVDQSSVCVCYVTHGGGSAYTRSYAEAQGLSIIDLS